MRRSNRKYHSWQPKVQNWFSTVAQISYDWNHRMLQRLQVGRCFSVEDDKLWKYRIMDSNSRLHSYCYCLLCSILQIEIQHWIYKDVQFLKISYPKPRDLGWIFESAYFYSVLFQVNKVILIIKIRCEP